MIRLQWSRSDGWLEVPKNDEIPKLTFAVTIVFEDKRWTLRSPWSLQSSPTWIAAGFIVAESRHVCGRSRLQRNKGCAWMEFLKQYGPRAPWGRPAYPPSMDVGHGSQDDPSAPMAWCRAWGHGLRGRMWPREVGRPLLLNGWPAGQAAWQPRWRSWRTQAGSGSTIMAGKMAPSTTRLQALISESQ